MSKLEEKLKEIGFSEQQIKDSQKKALDSKKPIFTLLEDLNVVKGEDLLTSLAKHFDIEQQTIVFSLPYFYLDVFVFWIQLVDKYMCGDPYNCRDNAENHL